mmetsp:Transcript_6163/g.15893  ORF Transcript_6163/g.15893 Transcript_6163/m.15893 type:complete len:309 (-) Transcript_6163:2-928(-)
MAGLPLCAASAFSCIATAAHRTNTNNVHCQKCSNKDTCIILSRREKNSVLVGSEDNVVQRKEKKDDAANKGHCPLGDLHGEKLPPDHRPAGADGVPNDPSDRDSDRILVRGQRDRRDLAPVPPLCEEREHKRFQENWVQHELELLEGARLHYPRLVRGLVQLVVHLRYLVVNLVVFALVPNVKQPQSEEGVQNSGGVVGGLLANEVWDNVAQRRTDDGHQRQRRNRSREDDALLVPHGQDGRDDERFVADLADQNHREAAHQPLDEGRFPFGRHLVSPPTVSPARPPLALFSLTTLQQPPLARASVDL